MRTLDKRIVRRLSELLPKEPSTIEKDISNLGMQYPNCTPNARAQIYARQNNVTVRRFLDKEDKASLPSSIELVKPIQVRQRKARERRKERIIRFISYPTHNPFRQAHIDEVNRAYTYKCYTCVFILCRKIIENLVADILRLKFPPITKENKELYYDIGRNRIRDFKELLKSLRSKKAEFEMDKKLVEKILSSVEPFKEEADQKAHSWYHIVKTRAEIDSMGVQNILNLLYELESKLTDPGAITRKASV